MDVTANCLVLNFHTEIWPFGFKLGHFLVGKQKSRFKDRLALKKHEEKTGVLLNYFLKDDNWLL